MRSLRWAAVACALVACAVTGTPPVRAESVVTAEARALHRAVPDVTISVAGGEQVKLSSLWHDKPVLITLFYQRCLGSCSPFLRSLSSTIKTVGGLGDDYRVVSVSFDPEDTPERTHELATQLGLGPGESWKVGTTSPAQLQPLMDSVGFWYRAIPGTDQVDHPSLVAMVRDGRVVRVLLGNTVSPTRFQELRLEARGTFVPFYAAPDASTRFRCLDVDPATGQLRLGWGLVVLLLPAALALALSLAVFRLARPRPAPAE
ncbi:MAG: SCO family protein [Polyangiaceae bacterium]|nr:SCO family protein [Polyangiaceae bacterium]